MQNSKKQKERNKLGKWVDPDEVLDISEKEIRSAHRGHMRRKTTAAHSHKGSKHR